MNTTPSRGCDPTSSVGVPLRTHTYGSRPHTQRSSGAQLLADADQVSQPDLPSLVELLPPIGLPPLGAPRTTPWEATARVAAAPVSDLNLQQQRSTLLWSVVTVDRSGRVFHPDGRERLGWLPVTRLDWEWEEWGARLSLPRPTDDYASLHGPGYEPLSLDERLRLRLPMTLRLHLGVEPGDRLLTAIHPTWRALYLVSGHAAAEAIGGLQ